MYKLLTILVIGVISLPLELLACKCTQPDPISDYKNASLVVTGYVQSGEIEEIKSSESFTIKRRKFVIKPKKVHKGKEEDSYTIYTRMGGGDCGYNFIIGKHYLIFAFGKEGLTTNICSSTRRFDNKAEQIVNSFDKKGS